MDVGGYGMPRLLYEVLNLGVLEGPVSCNHLSNRENEYIGNVDTG